jgi:hypothetical protein
MIPSIGIPLSPASAAEPFRSPVLTRNDLVFTPDRETSFQASVQNVYLPVIGNGRIAHH